MPIGTWRDHFDFRHINSICELDDNTIVGGAANGLLFLFPDGSMNKLTKVDGLSDFGISSIAFSEKYKKIIVGYENGNIDILQDKNITNISDLKRKNLAVEKNIYRIVVDNDFAYLACGFGIIKLGLKNDEIIDTYYIGDEASFLKVFDITFFNDSIFAATNKGLRCASLNDILSDYNNWKTVDMNDTSAVRSIAELDNVLFMIESIDGEYKLLRRDSLYHWQTIVSSLSSDAFIRAYDILYLMNQDFFYQINSQGTITNTKQFNYFYATDFLKSKDDKYYFSQKTYGIKDYDGYNVNKHIYQGVYLDQGLKIAANNHYVYVTRGGYKDNGTNLYLTGILNVFDLQTNMWSTITNYSASDYNSIALDSTNENHVLVGSWGFGVFDYLDNELMNVYNTENSPLQSILTSPNYIRVSGLTYDNNDNLWVLNQASDYPLNVLQKDRNWISYTLSGIASNQKTSQILYTKSGNIWLELYNKGFVALDFNNTVDDQTDDFYKLIIPYDEGERIGSIYYCATEDKNGDIWFGTNEGVGVFYSENEFKNDYFKATRIKLTAELNDSLVTNYLLAEENVLCIAVDGGNRKWIGTASSGLYLMNEDGTEQLAHFTTENSPLPSNKITSIAIVPNTGEVFIVTSKGIVSYMSDANEATEEFENVYVYPNPVREDYEGEITIAGMVYQTNIKITDLTGNIVYETKSEGGRATWDGRNFSGQRVATGVYLVFCTTEDAKKTFITKILFIN